MKHLDSTPAQELPNPLSGNAIAGYLANGGELAEPAAAELPAATNEAAKQALNERLRAERFGIQGAMIDRFADDTVTEDYETGRPTFTVPINARHFTRRAYPSHKSVNLVNSIPGYDSLPPGDYEYWTNIYKPGGTSFADFQQDAEVALETIKRTWAIAQLDDHGKVAQWADRLVEVSKQQVTIDVTEAIITEDNDDLFKGTDTKVDDSFDALQSLPIENITSVYAELAHVTLEELDRLGINDESERLRALDDIVLQALNTSQHHIAHFRNGEARDMDSKQLRELGAALRQDESGRYSLDWVDRVKPRPREKMLSRTQHCAAAYKTEAGKPSALERLGWALNTALKARGLLVPGAANDPAPIVELPPPRLIGTSENDN